jgi:hypothetical protein
MQIEKEKLSSILTNLVESYKATFGVDAPQDLIKPVLEELLAEASKAHILNRVKGLNPASLKHLLAEVTKKPEPEVVNPVVGTVKRGRAAKS